MFELGLVLGEALMGGGAILAAIAAKTQWKYDPRTGEKLE